MNGCLSAHIDSTVSLFDNRMENDNVKKSTNCELFIKFVHACDVLCIRQLAMYVLHLCMLGTATQYSHTHTYIYKAIIRLLHLFSYLQSCHQTKYYLVYRHTYCIKYSVYCNIAWAIFYPINYSETMCPLWFTILGGRWVLG